MQSLSSESEQRKQNFTVHEYAEELRKWMTACACWQATMFHYSTAVYQGAAQHALLLNSSQTASWNSLPVNMRGTNQPANQGARQYEPAQQPNVNNLAADQAQFSVTRYRVPALWRRVAAESIDFLILVSIRVVLVALSIKFFNLDETLSKAFAEWSLTEWAGARVGMREARAPAHAPVRFAQGEMFWQRLDGEEVEEQIQDEDYEQEAEFDDLLFLNPVYLLLELTNTLVVTAYETLFTMREWRRGAGSCTPGKMLLGLRLVRAAEMLELVVAPDRGLLGSPGLLVDIRGDVPHIGFSAALCRALMKNFSQTFLFPLSITAMFARNRRAAYDIMTNLIVVEVA